MVHDLPAHPVRCGEIAWNADPVVANRQGDSFRAALQIDAYFCRLSMLYCVVQGLLRDTKEVGCDGLVLDEHGAFA